MLHTVTGCFKYDPTKVVIYILPHPPSPNNTSLPRYKTTQHVTAPNTCVSGLSSLHRHCISSSLRVVLLSSVNYTALSRRGRPRASVTTQLRPCKSSLRYPIGCQLIIHLTSLSSPFGGCRIFVDIT
jgi:hypothetical protein